MNERKVLDYTGWASRIENTGANATRYLDNLLGLDKRILDMQEKLQGTDIGSFDYESLANNMRASMMGVQVLFEYAMDTERAIDELDTGFMTALSKGAVEDLSLIRMDDITVDNTIGMKETYMVGYGDSRCAVERTKNKLTLNDFIGGEGAGCMTGYVKEFADLFRNQYLEAGGEEENFSKYLKELYTMGEFDHKKYQPVKTFLSDILDVVTLGVKPLLEGLFQYEFITGETLTDTESLFKVVEGVVGLITVGTGSYGKGVAVIAQELLAEATANVTVERITQLGEELGLPPIVTAILALAGGVAAGKAVNGCFVDEDQLLKQYEIEKLELKGESIDSFDTIENPNMLFRKAKDVSYIEPMPKKQLQRITKAFKKQGGIIQMDDATDAYLISKNAEAITLNENTILLHQKPGRASVFEELIHATQFRQGLNDGSVISRIQNEIAAQEILLKNSRAYKLTPTEITQTQSALLSYIEELKKVTGGN